jgi:hypothetical protein
VVRKRLFGALIWSKIYLRGAFRRLLLVERIIHSNSSRNVQAVLSFDRKRLERDRAIETADENIGAGSNPQLLR